MISASIFLRMPYLTAFWYLLFGNDSSLPNKRNEAAWTAAWSGLEHGISPVQKPRKQL